MGASLRIAHINTECTWRGGEQQNFSLIKGLQAKGHFNLAVVQKNSLFAKELKNINIPLVEVNPLGEWDILAAWKIRLASQKHNMDLLHAHTGHGASLAGLAALGTRWPLVFSRRVDFHLKKNLFSRWKYKQATKIIAISKGVKDVLLADGILEDKITVIPSGVDFTRFQNVTKASRSEMHVPEDAVVVGQLAALADHKDQMTLIQAATLVRKDVPNAVFVIVGEGEMRPVLERAIERRQAGSYVRLLGFQKDPLRFLSAFDIFCLSSKLEGMGTSVLDAMALKIPVVATRAGGIPEMVEDGETGYLATPRDPASLAQTLVKAIRSPEKNKTFCEKAFEKVREFDVIHTIGKTEALYRSLLASKTHR